MKELAIDIIKMNKRCVLAKSELEKMIGCKLEDMTDNQKTIGLAMLVSFESKFDYVEIGNCEKCKWKNRHQKCSCCRRNRYIKDCYQEF